MEEELALLKNQGKNKVFFKDRCDKNKILVSSYIEMLMGEIGYL
jgi:hypothetical protein